MLFDLLSGALCLGVLIVLACGVMLLAVATWRVREPSVAACEREDYSETEWDRQQRLRAIVEGAGFQFAGLQVEHRSFPLATWQALFRKDDGTVWGVVESREGHEPRLVFHSFCGEAVMVTTAEGAFSDLPAVDGKWFLTEADFHSRNEQAETHRSQVDGTGCRPLEVVEVAEFRRRYSEVIARQSANLCEAGLLRRSVEDETVFEVSPWKAPRLAFRMMRCAFKERGLWAASGLPREDGKASPSEAVARYRLDRCRGTVFSRLGWSVEGAVLFVAILVILGIGLAGGVLQPVSVLIILAVLGAHDLGHALAMRVFGYREARLFVCPVIGLLAPYRTVRAPVWQRFVALAMGPFPGLVIGWTLLVAAFLDPSLPEFWREVGFWAALVNNLSLLTVLPYDGGRLLSLLILERAPALRPVAVVLSSGSVLLTVVAAALVFGTGALAVLWPFLILAIVPLLMLPAHLRLAKIAPVIRTRFTPDDNEEEALGKAVAIVGEGSCAAGRTRAEWTAEVDEVIRHGCTKRFGWLGTSGALVCWMAGLFTPLWVMGGMIIGEGRRVAFELRELQSEIADVASKTSWSGAVVTNKTREDLATLRDHFQDALAHRYGPGDASAVEVTTTDDGGVFDLSEAIYLSRRLRWDEVSSWIAEEDTVSRQQTARVLVRALIEHGAEKAAAGKLGAAWNAYSKAYWAISTCEPKSSFAAWIDWLYLERDLLLEIEEFSSTRGIPSEYGRWFSETLRNRPAFAGEKMALLLLLDLQGGAPLEIPGPGLAETASFPQLYGQAGFPLRRSKADRDYRREVGAGVPDVDLGTIMETMRMIQGLPTREEFEAGIAVARHWRDRRALDYDVLAEIEDAGQRAVWKGRIDRISRLRHYRSLAVTALEMELAAMTSPAGGSEVASKSPPGVEVSLVRGPGDRFAVTSKAPDGTRFTWQLSPSFRERRRTF